MTEERFIETDLILNPIIKDWFIDGGDNLGDLIYKYGEPHRYYHNINHLRKLLLKCEESELSKNNKWLMQIVILFHDHIYDPRNPAQNEIASAEAFKNAVKDKYRTHKMFKMAYEAIEASDYKTKVSKDNFIFRELRRIDLIEPLFYATISELITNEALIRKEYQYAPYEKYIEGRVKFLGGLNRYSENIIELLKYIQNYTLNVGLYAGSFNPFHIGHLDILEQAEKHFDKVIVLLAINPDKHSSPSADLTLKTNLQRILPFHEVDYTCGLLTLYVQFLRGKKQRVTVVRGLRNGYDLDYELNIKSFMDEIGYGVDFVYFVSQINKQHISSSAVRGIEKFDKFVADKYLPKKYSYYTTPIY